MSVCVVCYERESVNTNRVCHDKSCRGSLVVCAECDAALSKCVYCHHVKSPVVKSTCSSRAFVKMFMALLYAGLIGHFSNICFETEKVIANRDVYVFDLSPETFLRSTSRIDSNFYLSSSSVS